jgi:gamma-glutamyl-gamma-aminobutyrate hydrolase PuuD
MSKPLIGITESEPQYMAPFIDVIEKANGVPFPIYPKDHIDVKSTLDKLDGLLIGGGPDIHPSEYGESIEPDASVSTQVERDAMELPLLIKLKRLP